MSDSAFKIYNGSCRLRKNLTYTSTSNQPVVCVFTKKNTNDRIFDWKGT